MTVNSIHKFSVDSIDGGQIDFAAYSGKKILVVNVASECGYTPQYRQLQDLYEAFRDKLVIVGCPCNDFGGQEPGSAEDIQSFCTVRYGVSFPLTGKLSIKGESPHPLYQWLTRRDQNGVADSEVAWNFCKFLLDEEGKLIKAFPSAVEPADASIIDLIET